MHWHYPLKALPPRSVASRKFLPCSCSLSKICYVLYSKYPSLLLNPNNGHLSFLKLHARNPFLFLCSPNPCFAFPCYWSSIWLPGVLPHLIIFIVPTMQLCVELPLLSKTPSKFWIVLSFSSIIYLFLISKVESLNKIFVICTLYFATCWSIVTIFLCLSNSVSIPYIDLGYET